MTGISSKFDGRPDIIFENGTLYGGLHCGECFSVLETDAGWVSVRLELIDDWVLVDGNRGKTFPIPYGDHVKV